MQSPVGSPRDESGSLWRDTPGKAQLESGPVECVGVVGWQVNLKGVRTMVFETMGREADSKVLSVSPSQQCDLGKLRKLS